MAISYVETASWNVGGTSGTGGSYRDLTIGTVAIGDVVLVWGVASNYAVSGTGRSVSTGTGSTAVVTWGTAVNPSVVLSNDVDFTWRRGVVTTAGTLIARVQLRIAGADTMGAGAWLIPAAEVGAAEGALGSSFAGVGTNIVSRTVPTANSRVWYMMGDWNAVITAATTGNPGTNVTYGTRQQVVGQHSVWGALWENQATGTRNYGMAGSAGLDASGFVYYMEPAPAGGDVLGTLGASVPVVTGALTGESVNAGTVAADVPKVTGALTGQSVNTGSLAATTPGVTAALTGASVNAGSLAAVTPKVTATVAGQSVNAGSLNAATPTVTASVTGASVNVGTLTGAVPRVTTSIADQATNTGTLAVTLPKVTAALTGTATNTGTLAAVIPKVTTAIADTTTLAGTLAVTVPKITALINGASVNAGSMTLTVPRVTAGITGQLVNVGTLDAATPLVVCTLTADQVLTGSLAAVLPLLRFRATTAIDRDITVTGMLEPRRYSAGITARTKSGTIYRRWGGTLNE